MQTIKLLKENSSNNSIRFVEQIQNYKKSEVKKSCSFFYQNNPYFNLKYRCFNVVITCLEIIK